MVSARLDSERRTTFSSSLLYCESRRAYSVLERRKREYRNTTAFQSTELDVLVVQEGVEWQQRSLTERLVSA